jgi:hypothetical protein
MSRSRNAIAAGALAAGALLCGAFVASPALAAESAAASVSSNWAGYAAVAPASVGSRFTGVSGTWTEPDVTCIAGREAFSAVWVGLGGYSRRPSALEQIGTDANCSRSGTASYSSWYELLPAGPVKLALKLRAGDEMSASVSVERHRVTLSIRDLSTGAHFKRTLRMAHVDSSSAEWIVEAPATCEDSENCEILPLTDFGEVLFSRATATGRAHTSPVAASDWAPTALELQQVEPEHLDGSAGAGESAGAGTRATETLTLATPSPSARDSGAFSVSWKEQSIQSEPPERPTLPGGGDPP